MGIDYKFVSNRSKFMQGRPQAGVKKAINEYIARNNYNLRILNDRFAEITSKL